MRAGYNVFCDDRMEERSHVMKRKILYTAEEYEAKFGKDYLDDNPPDHEDYDSNEPYITEADYEFEKDIRSVLQGLIDNAFSSLTEDKNDNEKSKLIKHFNNKHCLGDNQDKKSIPSNIYYDFKTKEQYKQYALLIIDLAKSTTMQISSLFDEELFDKYIREFFEGNQTICFTNSCGFHIGEGDATLALHSRANKVTGNDPRNTIDILVMTPKKRFLTIYPVDAQELENKFHSVIAKYNDANAHGVS